MRAIFLACVLFASVAAGAAAQTVTKVSSGDTIVVDGVGKVRLVGIRSVDESAFSPGSANQPPARHDPPSPTSLPPSAVSGGVKFKPSRPSRDFLEDLLLGKAVKLEFDPLIGKDNTHYAYVFLPDGAMANAEMLKQGRARLDDSRAFAHQEEFTKLQQDAKDAGLGVWVGTPHP